MVKRQSGKTKKEFHFPVKNVLLAVAIALVTVFFIGYATESFYPSPNYEGYCNRSQFEPIGRFINNSEDCLALGGQWQPYGKPLPGEGVEGYCDEYFTCNQEYQDAREVHERNMFFLNILLGLIIIVASFILSFETVSNGFMGGGVLMLFYGSVRYWSQLDNVFRTLMLGIALIVLVWVGYKKLK